MHEKFQNADFGRCPRVYCQGQPGLPVGLSDLPRCYSVNIYCPRCQELYYPRASKHGNIDGAFFGTTFAHLFLLQNPDLLPPKSQESYVPRIYGFRINNESAYFSNQRSNYHSPFCPHPLPGRILLQVKEELHRPPLQTKMEIRNQRGHEVREKRIMVEGWL